MTESGRGGRINQAGEIRSSRVESIRALAALAVLVGHVALRGHGEHPGRWLKYVLAGGFGVYVFFALSGYLLFRPFVRANWGDGEPVHLGRYAANRALRILPLYYIVAAFFIIVRGHGNEWGTIWRFLLILPNTHQKTVIAVDGGMWSIVVEVEFYILLPLIAWALARVTGRSLARGAAAVAALAVAVFVFHLATVTYADAASFDWKHSLPATFVYFFPGMLLALLVQWVGRERPQWLNGALRYSDVWIGLSLPLFLLVAHRYSWNLLLLPACFLLVGGAVLPLESGLGTRFLDWRPLAALGVASYSLYLWHGPIVSRLADANNTFLPLLLLSLVICITVAVVSYRLIETPFLRLRKRWQGAPAETPAGDFVATASDAVSA